MILRMPRNDILKITVEIYCFSDERQRFPFCERTDLSTTRDCVSVPQRALPWHDLNRNSCLALAFWVVRPCGCSLAPTESGPIQHQGSRSVKIGTRSRSSPGTVVEITLRGSCRLLAHLISVAVRRRMRRRVALIPGFLDPALACRC